MEPRRSLSDPLVAAKPARPSGKSGGPTPPQLRPDEELSLAEAAPSQDATHGDDEKNDMDDPLTKKTRPTPTPTSQETLPTSQESLLVSEAAAPPVSPRVYRPTKRRMRDELHLLEDRLRLDVNSIRQQIVDLNLQRLVFETKRIVQRKILRQKAVETVVEYFGAFQHGWIFKVATTDEEIAELQSTVTRSFGVLRSPRQAHEQAAFLRERQRLLIDRQRHFVATAIDPAMQLGAFTNGVEMFVHQWRKFSEYHKSPRLTLTCMTCHGSADEPIVVAVGTFSGVMTFTVLADVYPQALEDPDFVRQLVGATIKYPSREVFYFDNGGRIVRYDRDLDYPEAFASLLGCLDDAASVLADVAFGGIVGIGVDPIEDSARAANHQDPPRRDAGDVE